MEMLAASLPTARSPVLGGGEHHNERKLGAGVGGAGVGAAGTNNSSSSAKSGSPPVPASTRFIGQAIRELIKARRILCGSYVFGYCRTTATIKTCSSTCRYVFIWWHSIDWISWSIDDSANFIFLIPIKNELESLTEKLSEMVARPYLRTRRSVIIDMTQRTRRKRHELLRAVSRGLVPPADTPPTMRKVRRRKLPALVTMDLVQDVLLHFSHLFPLSLWFR